MLDKLDDLPYDETNPQSIENYGKKMIGKTFLQICEEDDKHVVDNQFDYEKSHENRKRKGGLGEVIEERFFHYKANSDSRADFDKAGVELKVSPYKVNKNKTVSAKERLVLSMIDYHQVIHETFENSHMWKKSKSILLVYYLYEKEKERLNYKIDYVKLFTPPEKDIQVIKNDFEIIVNKIRAGKAHELSEGDTMYLGAVTKSSDSSKRRSQPNSDILAKPRAFAFKNSYMTYVLNEYIRKGNETCESIMSNQEGNLQDYIMSKIDRYHNATIDELCRTFDVYYEKKPKNLEATLIYRILGIKGNKAEEFVKANIVVKTIRIGNNNKIKEHMSFPHIIFKDFAKETWDDSTFGNYLRETKFLFVVYKYDSHNVLHLKGCQFWNIPYKDLEEDVKKVWLLTQKIVKEGPEIEYKNGKRCNNFPKQSVNRVCHVRPHGKNAEDTCELPNGNYFTKQCFWLNNSYILSQLDKKFLDD